MLQRRGRSLPPVLECSRGELGGEAMPQVDLPPLRHRWQSWYAPSWRKGILLLQWWWGMWPAVVEGWICWGICQEWSRAASADLGRCSTGCCCHLQCHMLYSDLKMMAGSENLLLYILYVASNLSQSPSASSKCVNAGTAWHKFAATCCLGPKHCCRYCRISSVSSGVT